jgi:DNA-binding IclR family transcriptional regulator
MAEERTIDAAAPTGAQSIERAFSVLRVVAAHRDKGARLTDIVAAIGVSKPTVRRILAAMMRERAIEQDPVSRLYFLGQEMYVFGTVAADRYGIHKIAVPSLVRLAQISEDTVFLSVPIGGESVCLHCEEGAFPIRSHALSVGRRHPLGVGAGSLALLSAMPDHEVDRIIATNAKVCADKYAIFTAKLLRELVGRTRQIGYALIEALVVPGSYGIGVAVPDDRGRPLAALSIAAIASRMTPERRQELVAAMYAERDRLRGAIARAQSLERHEPERRMVKGSARALGANRAKAVGQGVRRA